MIHEILGVHVRDLDEIKERLDRLEVVTGTMKGEYDERLDNLERRVTDQQIEIQRISAGLEMCVKEADGRINFAIRKVDDLREIVASQGNILRKLVRSVLWGRSARLNHYDDPGPQPAPVTEQDLEDLGGYCD